jgi:hypothetical protein
MGRFSENNKFAATKQVNFSAADRRTKGALRLQWLSPFLNMKRI